MNPSVQLLLRVCVVQRCGALEHFASTTDENCRRQLVTAMLEKCLSSKLFTANSRKAHLMT